MNEQMQQELLKRLDALAEKLGTTAEHLWGVLLAQARVELIWASIWCAFGVVLFLLACFAFGMALKEKAKNDAFDWFITSLVVGGIGGICILWHGYTLLTCGLNPEYWALQKVLETLR